MKYRISGKKLEITEGLRTAVIESLNNSHILKHPLMQFSALMAFRATSREIKTVLHKILPVLAPCAPGVAVLLRMLNLRELKAEQRLGLCLLLRALPEDLLVEA